MAEEKMSPGDISSATKSFSQQSQKINIALQYTEGNMDLAKKMVAGELKDVYIIKMKLRSDLTREFGLMILFLNRIGLQLKFAAVAMSRSPYIYDARTNINWNQYYQDILNGKKDADFDEKVTAKVQDLFLRLFATANVAQAIQHIDSNEHDSLSEYIHGMIREAMQLKKSHFSMDYEITSSLLTDEAGIEDRTLSQKKLKAKSEDEERKSEIPADILKIASEALAGSSVMSPTKGRDLPKLQVGDKIKIHITDTSERGRNIVKILNAATEEGTLKPVPAKIRFIRKKSDGNWLILVDLGDNIFVRLEEETDNVRIAVIEAPVMESANTSAKGKSSLPLILGMVVGIVVIFIAILIFLFL